LELSKLKGVNAKFLILRVLRNRVLRRIFLPKRDEVIGGYIDCTRGAS
jgi:hypothetical protein